MRAPVGRDVLERTKISTGWRSYFKFLDNKIENRHKTADSVSVVAGGTPVGTIAGVQTWNDGSVYQVPEVAATPGFDIRFTIGTVKSFSHISSNVLYSGASTHQVEWQIYNVTEDQWDTLTQVPHGFGYNFRYIDFPNDNADYINTSGQVIIRLYHISAGNAAHDIYIDYLALAGVS